jgi:CubicO group peptidase (beta-lactamase class C family)
MGELKPDVEPGEVGIDAERLARLDRHFARYVDDGKLAGWVVTLSRHGKLAHVSAYGQRDIESGLPAETDTLWRIYSMTKPITSVAAMMLYEEGAFELTDPVDRYIPAFRDVRVFDVGSDMNYTTVPATQPIRIWHLLSHTSGLTYGFMRNHPVDAMYRANGFDFGQPSMDLATACDRFAGMPLLFQPGSEWSYSIATDVLGRLVEVLSGQRLDEFFAESMFGPLGMTDTSFYADQGKADRLAALYGRHPKTGSLYRLDALSVTATKQPTYLSGGGGLVSTAADYNRFTQMLLGTPDSPAGELDGVRLLSERTVRLMTANHLPGNQDLKSFGRPLYAETSFDGVGFGLGFAVVLDPVANKSLGSAGEFNWGGAASTTFWVDPAEEVTATFFTQLLPSNTYPIRPQLRQLVYQSLLN